MTEVVQTKEPKPSTPEMDFCLKVDNISVGYQDTKILENISFKAPRGSTVAIVGPSGAGKTTLFKSIIGLLEPNSGNIQCLGEELYHQSAKKKLRGRVGYIPQALGLVNSLDVKTNVLLGSLGRTSTFASMFGLFGTNDHKEAISILEKLKIKEKINVNVRQLSGGERRRVAIARAMLQKPHILIADEFLSELDIATARNVMDIVKDMQEKTEMTLLLIEHNIDMAERYADTILFIKEGRIEGTYSTDDLQELAALRGRFDDVNA